MKVRVQCTGDTGATCKGRVRIKAKGKTLGSKRFTIAAGKSRSVVVKLKKASFKKLVRTRTRKVTLRLSGQDSAGARIAAKRSVILGAPKRR